jgi:isocitrate lyase
MKDNKGAISELRAVIEEVYKQGWLAAASFCDRDDLKSDVGSYEYNKGLENTIGKRDER